MATGKVVVEKVGGRSTATSCFSKYPLKFLLPSKVSLFLYVEFTVSNFQSLVIKVPATLNFQAAPAGTDVVWIYSITYGGGIVSVFPYFSVSLLMNLPSMRLNQSSSCSNYVGRFDFM